MQLLEIDSMEATACEFGAVDEGEGNATRPVGQV